MQFVNYFPSTTKRRTDEDKKSTFILLEDVVKAIKTITFSLKKNMFILHAF